MHSKQQMIELHARECLYQKEKEGLQGIDHVP